MTSPCVKIVQHTEFASVKTTIFRQQNLCVQKSDMFWPRIGHSQAHSNSNNTCWGRWYTNISLIT